MDSQQIHNNEWNEQQLNIVILDNRSISLYGIFYIASRKRFAHMASSSINVLFYISYSDFLLWGWEFLSEQIYTQAHTHTHTMQRHLDDSSVYTFTIQHHRINAPQLHFLFNTWNLPFLRFDSLSISIENIPFFPQWIINRAIVIDYYCYCC